MATRMVEKEAVMQTIKECAEKLGHAPSLLEIASMTKLSKRNIRKYFGTYALALQACGLERHGCGYYVSTDTLFIEWAEIVRKIKKIPTITEFELHCKFSSRPLMSRFKTWNSVPLCLLEYARKHGLDAEWKDVIDIIAGHAERRRRAGIPYGTTSVTPARSRMLVNQPLFGTPLGHPAMTYAPTGEQGVIFLFGAMAVDLGYAVSRIQTECPDCEATRRVGRDRCQRVRTEFEFESRNFLLHLHRVEDCDLIVCWEHNWPECPLEVLSLKDVLEKSGKLLTPGIEQEKSPSPKKTDETE